jgi:hypothetical protein
LPDAPRCLGGGPILNRAEHREDIGRGDALDRDGAEGGKHVTLQRMEYVIRVLFDPVPLVDAVPFAGDGLERGPAVRNDLQAPEPLLDGGVLPLSQEPLSFSVGDGFSRFGDPDRGYGPIESSFSVRSNSYLRRHCLPPAGVT